MKTLISKLLKCRLARAGGLLVIIAAVTATIAASSSPGVAIKLDGAWIAQSDNGIRSLVTYAPSDASGQRAVLRNQQVWPPALLAYLGLDAVTEEIAEEVVTGPNTSAYSGIWYGLAGGSIVSICLDNATLTHVSPTEKHIEHTVVAYLATTDADNDGYPDPGSTPMGTFSATTISKRLAR